MSEHGDPFAQAYARNGNQNGASRTGGRQAASSPNAYQGYGFGSPGASSGAGCPPSANEALEECVRAAQKVLADTIQRYQKVPWHDQSFRARPTECRHTQVVISTTAAFDAATNASGLLLQSANVAPGFPVPLLEMGSATDAQDIFEIAPEQSYMARIKSWGVSYGASGPKAVTLRIKGTSVGGAPTPPSPFLSGLRVEQHQDTFVILQPKQKIVVQALLNDPVGGPVLIDFSACFWLWPINKRSDKPEGAILRSGYGVDC